VLVVGAGKAATGMAQAAVDLLGPETAGEVVAPGSAGPIGNLRVHAGGHPLPTAGSCAGATAILDRIAAAPPSTLVLVLLSGGASALLAAPTGDLTLENKRDVTARLLGCGASIAEINAVRKHCSRVKGGLLARHAAPRPLWALVLSDVIGDDLATIGSGPTAPDPSSFVDGLQVFLRYGIEDRVPRAVLEHLRAGAAGRRPETPKPGDPCFERVHSEVIGSNRVALAGAAAGAEALGFDAVVIEEPVSGETLAAATRFAMDLVERLRTIRQPTCVLAGGETTVTLRGPGSGGRNQEFALAAALVLRGHEGVTVLSAGTDGIDGPTDAAGAFADGWTADPARTGGLDPRAALDANDSHGYFTAAGGLFAPGPTGTNVMDVKIALLTPRSV
jgi:hydroxypyruvate reductase